MHSLAMNMSKSCKHQGKCRVIVCMCMCLWFWNVCGEECGGRDKGQLNQNMLINENTCLPKNIHPKWEKNNTQTIIYKYILAESILLTAITRITFFQNNSIYEKYAAKVLHTYYTYWYCMYHCTLYTPRHFIQATMWIKDYFTSRLKETFIDSPKIA